MRAIVKGFVIGTLGLAVLFGSPALSLAAMKAGGNNCSEGPPEHLPPGKHCGPDYKETSLNKCPDKSCPGCVAVCCKGDADGDITSCVDPVSVKLDPLRNVRPNLPATIYVPSAPVSPGGPRPQVAPSQK